jgi:serine/threonine protein phosphatase PrpC
VSLLGVFDGHGGQDTSHYLRENFGQRLCERLRANKFNYTLSLEETFEALDAEIVGLGFEAGSTATVCVITKDVIYFAQAGDSRAFVYSQGHGGAIRVTQEHLPTLPKEKARIEAAGGYVRRERVNGVLSMSRAFGNSEFKDNKKLTSQE